jgi:hypothetical protein
MPKKSCHRTKVLLFFFITEKSLSKDSTDKLLSFVSFRQFFYFSKSKERVLLSP